MWNASARSSSSALPGRVNRLTGTDLYLAADHALMGDSRGIVHIVDISDPANMRKVAEVPLPRTRGGHQDLR